MNAVVISRELRLRQGAQARQESQRQTRIFPSHERRTDQEN